MTPIAIVNIGLTALGERPIQSFDDGSVAAGCALTMFRGALEATLEAAPWNDAAARIRLSASATPPAFGYRHQYLLPGELLRVREIAGWRTRWAREGRMLLTDVGPPISVLYTRTLYYGPEGRPVLPGQDIPMGGLLAAAVGYRFAALSAMRITGQASSMKAAWGLYRDALVQANSIDAIEGTPPKVDVGSWVDPNMPDSWDI